MTASEAAEGGEAFSRDRGRRRARELVAVFAASCAIALWWLWPLPRHAASSFAYPNRDVPGVTADLDLVVWSLAWGAHALVRAPWDLFRGNAFHPSPFALAYSEHFLGSLPLFAPAYLFSGDPVLSTNVLIFLSYPLCAVAMYALLRQWTAEPAAALGALAFAFSGHRHSLPPYVYLLSSFYLPLAALLLWRWLRAPRVRDAVLLALVALLQLLVSFYVAYAAIVAFAGFALATAAAPPLRRPTARELAVLGGALAAAAIALLAASWTHLELRALGIIPSYDEASIGGFTTLGLVPYFAARRLSSQWRDFGPPAVILALALLAVVRPVRERRWPLVLGVYAAIAGLVLAFGRAIHLGGRDWWSPYALLAALLPGFESIRQPIRFLVLFELGLAILAGLGAERLLGRTRWRWSGAAVAAVLWLVAVARLTPHPLFVAEPTPQERAPYAWLAEHGQGRPLLELPRARDFTSAARRMRLSTIHWLPIVEGYSGYPPRTDAFLYGIAAGLPAASSLQDLVDLAGIGWILVHLDELPESDRERWRALRDAQGLVEAARWESAILFRVTLGVARDRSDALFSRTRSLDGAPLVPLVGSCPGRIEVAQPPADRVSPRSEVRLRARVHNASTSTWPAHGFVPRHLVRLRWGLAVAGGRTIGGGAAEIPADVPARGAIDVPIFLLAPAQPGAYALRLSLEQVMDGPLSACGVEPVLLSLRVAPR